ncbi:hypothetical protein EDD16DRAFT_1514594 [Pisolithus croceorrhizus]|nr:hypothetical protein EV401DRAFT_1884111 [Pisolithus croceorrhizus]KAI6132440.1 hypothetical protein EDD16DRAFT_1514594 [Pisolithus croceorrhizus]KAI6168764.1 hypothetical protein EDD17DRAFT_1503528 [Pisolithus thermaeus]
MLVPVADFTAIIILVSMFLPANTPLPPCAEKALDDWTAYHNQLEFKLTNFLFMHAEMPAKKIDTLLDIWATSLIGLAPALAMFEWDNFAIWYMVKSKEYDAPNDQRHWQDFMSGDWAWVQVDRILSDNPMTARAMLVPIILGSDKTTVSVAMGQTDCYPLYLSIRNVYNTLHCVHWNAVVLITFPAIPKSTPNSYDFMPLLM